MKQDAASKVIRRWVGRAQPKEQKPKSLAGALLQAGITVVEVPAPERPRKRRDEQGRDEAPQTGKRADGSIGGVT